MDDAPPRTIVLNVCFLAIFIDGGAVPATAGAVAQTTHVFGRGHGRPHFASLLGRHVSFFRLVESVVDCTIAVSDIPAQFACGTEPVLPLRVLRVKARHFLLRM